MPEQNLELTEERLKELLGGDEGEAIEKLAELGRSIADQLQLPQGTAIDGPAHYNGYQVLDAICDAGLARGFCLGNAVKYLLRAQKKGKDLEDLKKAHFYLTWFLERYEKYEGETDGS